MRGMHFLRNTDEDKLVTPIAAAAVVAVPACIPIGGEFLKLLALPIVADGKVWGEIK